MWMWFLSDDWSGNWEGYYVTNWEVAQMWILPGQKDIHFLGGMKKEWMKFHHATHNSMQF